MWVGGADFLFAKIRQSESTAWIFSFLEFWSSPGSNLELRLASVWMFISQVFPPGSPVSCRLPKTCHSWLVNVCPVIDLLAFFPRCIPTSRSVFPECTPDRPGCLPKMNECSYWTLVFPLEGDPPSPGIYPALHSVPLLFPRIPFSAHSLYRSISSCLISPQSLTQALISMAQWGIFLVVNSRTTQRRARSVISQLCFPSPSVSPFTVIHPPLCFCERTEQ